MADAVYAVERKQRSVREADTNPDADEAVQDIVNRWKVRYHLARLAEPVSQCIAAPDLRGSHLRQRADFLRETTKVGGAPTVEDELVDTVEELATTRQMAGRLQERLQDCEDALSREQQLAREKDAEIEQLKKQLLAKQQDVDALRSDLAAAQDRDAQASMQRTQSRISRTASFKTRTASNTTAADVKDDGRPPENSPMPAPPPPGRHSTTAAGHTPTARRTSPSTGTPVRRSTRSPARVPPPAASSPSAQNRTPVRRRAFA